MMCMHCYGIHGLDILLSEKDPVIDGAGEGGGWEPCYTLHTIYTLHPQLYLTPNPLHLLSGLHILEESAIAMH